MKLHAQYYSTILQYIRPGTTGTTVSWFHLHIVGPFHLARLEVLIGFEHHHLRSVGGNYPTHWNMEHGIWNMEQRARGVRQQSNIIITRYTATRNVLYALYQVFRR